MGGLYASLAEARDSIAAQWQGFTDYKPAREARAKAREFIAGTSAGKRLSLRVADQPITRQQAREIATGAARDAMMMATEGGDLLALCEGLGVEYPASDYGHGCEVARLTDVGWWGRRLRVNDWREYETQQLRLGRVRHFVSPEIAQARTWHRAAIEQMLAGLYAVRSDGGAVMSLADLKATGTGNPVNRRCEWIVRAKGVAAFRAAQGMTWTFVTLTAPSKYHRMRTEAGTLRVNPRWEGATPRNTQTYLNRVWARIRAGLQRLGVEWSAVRAVEPHADATPHWHLCLFCQPASLPAIKALILKHALREDGGEPGAAVHRCTFKDYDGEPGDAAAMADRCIAYMVAYMSKNLDGLKTTKGDPQAAGDAFDVSGGERIELGAAVESARRVEAWATLWGIRQFQELGGGRVTCYRELRRVRDSHVNADVERVRVAADTAAYADFIVAGRQLGLELVTETSEQLIRQAAAEAGLPCEPSEALADLVLEKNLLNKWGEPLRRLVRGVRVAAVEVKTRLWSWSMIGGNADARKEAAERLKEAAMLRGAMAAYFRACLPLATDDARNKYESVRQVQRAFAVAPGFLFLRAPPARALDLCQ